MDKNGFRWAIINSTIASIKKEPYFKSELADEVLFGMIVRILKKETEGWYYIETHYGYNGYVHESDLIVNTEEALVWKNSVDYFISHSIVDIKERPSYKSFSTGLLTRGAFVHLSGNEEDKWIELLLPKNKKGWVRKSFVKKMVDICPKKNEELVRKNLVDTALLYLGTQYRWGGKSPMGIDCSGLCSTAYMLNGIIIYRDALLKDKYMRRISRDEIKKGDLLFFSGHVAMYIGDDRYVHSTGFTGGVVINSLNSEHDDYREDLDKDITGIGTIF